MAWDVFETRTENERETRQLGKNLAGLLQKGDVVALYGELGSGKTIFVKGICDGLGIDEPVTSPSFTLIQEYHGKESIAHFDFYRLESVREIEDLGLDDYFENSISLIEWAERGETILPSEHFKVQIGRIMKDHQFAEQLRQIQIRGPEGKGLADLK